MAIVMASGGQHGLQWVEEDTLGVTPVSPTMQVLRHTGTTLALTKEPLESAELRSDRQFCVVRLGAKQTSGDINFELSYGAFDELIAMALFSTWDNDTLKAGIIPRSMTIERQFADIKQYGVFRGSMINTMSLNIQPQAMVTGTFGIVGLDAGYSGTSLGGSGTSMSCSANAPFDAFTGGLKEGGSDVAAVTSIALTLSNGLEPFFAVGSESAVSIPSGRCDLTGTVQAAFIDRTFIDKFVNEAETSLEFYLTAPVEAMYTTPAQYKILLPRIKYMAANNPVSGEGPITIEMPFRALRDDTTGSNIVITRIAPV